MRTCKRSPLGWVCYLEAGHDGPCPAYPSWWNVREQLRWGMFQMQMEARRWAKARARR